MPDTLTITYERMAAVLERSGMLSRERALAVLARFAEYARDRLDPYEVACALEDFGLAVSVHADDIDHLEEGYTYLLRRAAALTGGAITVANVRLHEGEFVAGSRDDVLEFERNGELISISAEHYSDEYYDHLAACDAIDRLSPDDDPRSFRIVDFEREEHRHYDSILVLATPEQTEAMRKHLGLEFH
jgi:hypothetical protein